MSDYLGNPHHARTPAGGSSAYPQEPQNHQWCTATGPHPWGYPTTANPDLVHEPRFVPPGDNTYRADVITPLYPWRIHSDTLKQVVKNLASQVGSEVVEHRKEICGPNRSKITVVFEAPDEI